MTMTWTYKGQPISSEEDLPKDKKYIGFIYLITQKSTGKKYIGRKMLQKPKYKTVNKKKKKTMVQSDWLDYYSSSPVINEYVEQHGTDDFEREILVFVSSKGNMVYCEELALYVVGALENPDKWINENIRAKVYRNWCKADEVSELREALKKLA